MSITIAGIVGESIVDGPGIRLTVFTQGCPHRCDGCHNPDTWTFEGGQSVAAEEIFAMVKENPLLKGVTFSGGEPFSQAKELAPLASMLKNAGYETASYSGYTYEEIIAEVDSGKELLKGIDILIDGKFDIAQRSLQLLFKGSKNQRIVDVSESLKTGAVVLSKEERWIGEQK